MITRKQKAAILSEKRELIIAIINIISQSSRQEEEKLKLITFILMMKDVLDLENERLDYEKILELSTDGGN